jgi:hypothetical protein
MLSDTFFRSIKGGSAQQHGTAGRWLQSPIHFKLRYPIEDIGRRTWARFVLLQAAEFRAWYPRTVIAAVRLRNGHLAGFGHVNVTGRIALSGRTEVQLPVLWNELNGSSPDGHAPFNTDSSRVHQSGQITPAVLAPLGRSAAFWHKVEICHFSRSWQPRQQTSEVVAPAAGEACGKHCPPDILQADATRLAG